LVEVDDWGIIGVGVGVVGVEELLAPELAVQDAFLEIWELEVVFAIESAGAFGDCWVEVGEMIG
jgi:hypothetical protein